MCAVKDVHVAAKENLNAIRAALTGGGNPAVRTMQLPGLNHVFRTCERPSTEYGKIEETLAPTALNVVSGLAPPTNHPLQWTGPAR